MRVWYRASSGVDGALQTLAFMAVMATAPVWISGLLIYGVYAWATGPSAAEEAKAERARVAEVEQRHAADRRAEWLRLEAIRTAPWPALKCEALRVSHKRHVDSAKRGWTYAADAAEREAADITNHCKP